MKLGLFGFGKMGKRVAAVCSPHTIVDPEEADVLIDFSHASLVKGHVQQAIALNTPLVIGTTGWDEEKESIGRLVEEGGIGVIYGPNFSLGSALMREIVRFANQRIALFPEYDVVGIESHHKTKVDAPSGTARTLGVPFVSVRVGYDPGTHTVIYDSEVDTLEITHRARSRDGFAKGAIRAAEWIDGKRGFYPFERCLEGLCTD